VDVIGNLEILEKEPAGDQLDIGPPQPNPIGWTNGMGRGRGDRLS
jgi:hypothetical protein